MSKSYGNTLAVFDEVKPQRKQIMRIQTDSRPMEDPKDPEGDVLFDLLKLVATESEIADMTATYKKGGFGYGDVKKALATASETYWGPRPRTPSRVGHQTGRSPRDPRRRSRESPLTRQVRYFAEPKKHAACGDGRNVFSRD